MKRALGVAVVALVVGASSVARADTASDRARADESFRQARAAFNRGEFAAAGAAFEQAARFVNHPAPLLNAADAWERAKDFVRASVLCHEAKSIAEAASDFANAAEACLVRLAPHVAVVQIEGPAGTMAAIDAAGARSLPTVVHLAGGHHAIVAVGPSIEDGRVTRDVDVAAGETLAVTFPAVPKPKEAPPPPPARTDSPPRRPLLPTASWIAFGTSVVAGATAATFGVMTRNAKSDFDGGETTQALADRFHDYRLATNVAVGVAVVAIATGVVFWVLAPSRSTRPITASSALAF